MEKGKWKCNSFVYDRLHEAGLKTPNYSANEWASDAKIRGWAIVKDGSISRGDVVAIPRAGDSGHVGIVTTGGANPMATAAGEFKIQQSNYFWQSRDVTGASAPAVIRRWVGY